MNTCCNVDTTQASAVCPRNGRRYRQVALKTVQHMLARPWAEDLGEQAFYFCTDPDCNVVYFSTAGRTWEHGDLRCPVGQKSRHPDRPLCYCFDISVADLLNHTPATTADDLRHYVIEQTRNGNCDCEVTNPAGRCCLADFPNP